MSDHRSNSAQGVHVHRNADLGLDSTRAAGVNIAGREIAITTQAIRRPSEISVSASKQR